MSQDLDVSRPPSQGWSRRKLLASAGIGAAVVGVGFGATAPAADAVTTTNDYFSVLFYGATGNGTTDDTAAVQAAITAAQTQGGTVYFPAGKYLLKGTGTQLLLVSSQVRLLGDGNSSYLYIDSTVPNTTDVIRLSPPVGGGSGFGWIIDGLQFIPKSGTPARHAINIDISTSGQFMAKMLIQNCFVQKLNGRAIFLNNPTNADGLFTSTITNNFFHGGMSLQNAGDSINIIGNTLTDSNCGLDLSQVSGARNVVVAFNNITSVGGGVRITPGTIGGGPGGENKIVFNQIEQIATPTGPEGAMIAVVGTSTAIIGSTEIYGNNLDGHGFATNQVYLAYASYTKIRDNVMLSPASSAIKILSTSDNTEVNYNTFGAGQTANALVSDAGVGTIGVLRPVTLLNSWYNPDVVQYGTVGATKLPDGTVVCTGVIAGGATLSGTALFNLPVGFRPAFARRFMVSSMTGSTLAPAFLDVHANGDVVIIGGGNTFAALDSITFLAV